MGAEGVGINTVVRVELGLGGGGGRKRVGNVERIRGEEQVRGQERKVETCAQALV